MRFHQLITASRLVVLIASLGVILPLSAHERVASEAMEHVFVAASQAVEAGQNLPAGTAEYRVGPGCTYSSIQDAIDAIPNNGSGVVRVRTGTYHENLSVVNKSIDLLGGHTGCTGTGATGITAVNAASASLPALYMMVLGGPAGASHGLHVSRLIMYNGTGNLLAPGGGMSIMTASDRNVTVTVSRTQVWSNQSAFRGGGISLFGDGEITLALLDSSKITGNQVTGETPYGGGLYCSGDHTILMIGGSINQNIAGVSTDDNARGGGIYLDGCAMTWLAQTPVEVGDDASLSSNTAYGTGEDGGGGLYATGGAQVDLIGANFVIFGDPISSRPLRIHSNRAQADDVDNYQRGAGGAVYAFGSDTRVRLDRTWVYANHAASGAFHARSGGEIIVERGSETCHSPRRCSRVFDNTGFFNAVAFAHSNSKIRFSRSIISDNRDESSTYLSALFESQFGGLIAVDDSLVFGNRADVGLTAIGGSPTVRVQRSTFSANDFARGVIRLSNDSLAEFYDSILYEPGTPMAELFGASTTNADCVVWHDDQLGGSRTLVADPRFVDPENGLFYLKPDSPAINYCNVAPPAPGVDLDWNPRGVCHSTDQPCGAAVYDLGAYEYPLKIFSDRFEAAP